MAKKSSGWKAVKILVLIVIAIVAVSFLLSLTVDDEFSTIGSNVAIISISGPIVSQGDASFFGADVASADELIKQIKRAEKDDSIQAVVFEINSPGGSAVASDEIAREIKKVEKPTVGWIREVGASGGYWIASSTDHIVANRMSITGSIGVIASYLSFGGFLADFNITHERLTAGRLKDIGSPLREMTPEERILFRDSLDQIHDFFIREVAENRDMSRRDVEAVATGIFYIGQDAFDLGLVDELGSKDEVTAHLEALLETEVDYVRFKRERGFLESLSGIMAEQFFNIGKGIGTVFVEQQAKPTAVSILA